MQATNSWFGHRAGKQLSARSLSMGEGALRWAIIVLFGTMLFQPDRTNSEEKNPSPRLLRQILYLEYMRCSGRGARSTRVVHGQNGKVCAQGLVLEMHAVLRISANIIASVRVWSQVKLIPFTQPSSVQQKVEKDSPVKSLRTSNSNPQTCFATYQPKLWQDYKKD